MPDDRITTNGKELLLDGAHLADANSEECAQAIALLLNRGVLIMPTAEELEIAGEVGVVSASKIEWTDRSDWNPIRGCTRKSPGCGGPGDHGGCYAEAMAARFSDPGQWGHGFAERTSKGGRWTGKVELQEDRLLLPMRWKRPAKIFASSTSDVFHEELPDEAIDKIFAAMALAPQHTFQVLTKRADRMRDYTDKLYYMARNIGGQAYMLALESTKVRSGAVTETFPARARELQQAAIEHLYQGMPNVWLGTSVEDQYNADARREDLRATKAAVRFVSYEPALGPVDWTGWEFIDWLISGGESGPKARPAHPDWYREARDFCGFHAISYLHKQNGEFVSVSEVEGAGSHHHFPDDATVRRVGKKRAGRLLDGVEHNGYPTVGA